MNIIAQKVNDIFLDSLFLAHEVSDNPEANKPLIVNGIKNPVGLNKVRLEKNREEITSIMKSMDKRFFKESGGYSVLLLGLDINGTQWADPQHIYQFIVLVLGLDLAYFNMPREAWHSLPGGMPYITFNM